MTSVSRYTIHGPKFELWSFPQIPRQLPPKVRVPQWLSACVLHQWRHLLRYRNGGSRRQCLAQTTWLESTMLEAFRTQSARECRGHSWSNAKAIASRSFNKDLNHKVRSQSSSRNTCMYNVQQNANCCRSDGNKPGATKTQKIK